MVSITHEQNIICSKTHIDGTTHEQTIICRQLFGGHVMGSRPMKRKEKMHRMIMVVYHLPKNSGNFGWDVNGKTVLVCPNGNFPK